MKRLFVLLVVVGCGTGAPAERSTLDSIPKAAAAALRVEANGAEITHVGRERAGGLEVYEGVWHEDGLAREVKVTADGRVIERELEVSPAEVPIVVRGAAARVLPAGATITYVKLTNGNYEAEASSEGKEHEATFAPDGTRVRGDDDEGGDDDDDHEGGAD